MDNHKGHSSRRWRSAALAKVSLLLLTVLLLVGIFSLDRSDDCLLCTPVLANSGDELPPNVSIVDKKLSCQGNKAGKLARKKVKGQTIFTFLSLSKFYKKRNGGGGLTAQQKKLIKDANLRCKKFNTIETLFVDTSLKKSCKGNSYSAEKRECNGKSGQGFKSIKDALKVAGPGDTLLVRGGTLAPFRLSGSFKKSQLRVQNYPDETPLVDGKGISGDGVTIAGDGIVLSGFAITNLSAESQAIVIQSGTQNGIEDCYIYSVAGTAMRVDEGSATIQRNVLHHIGGKGIDVHGAHTVRANTLYKVGGSGIAASGTTLVHHNVLFRNLSLGVELLGAVQAYHNTIIYNHGSGMQGSSGAVAKNNLLSFNGGADLICGGALCESNYVGDGSFSGNSTLGGAVGFLSGLSLQADSDGDGVPDALFIATQQVDNISALTNAVRSLIAGYVELSADSLLINRGVNVAIPLTDFRGNGIGIYPDIGAIEYQFPGGGPGNPPPTATPQGGGATPTPTATPTSTATPTPTRTPIIVDEMEVPHPDLSSLTNFSTSIEFLYTGDDPIQRDVVPGTIKPVRVAVIRGQVLGPDNMPLSGVEVRVLNHPEFGYTLTRAGGSYDMAVNGGESLVVTFRKNGFLPSQRKVYTPLRDFVVVEDVMLTTIDGEVTELTLSSITQMEAAQGSIVIDDDGMRQGTVLVRPGVTAQLKFADGTTQPIDNLGIRVTEYTIGENGPAMMPGPLPMYSGYTYAAELSVDEAIAQGATDVLFSEPVPYYVENFLDFPVGQNVPVGFYDKSRAVWVAAPNGRVIKILDILGGLAVLDVTGAGTPATQPQLEALGIDVPELEKLATLYTVGQELWRVELEHFTPWDCNWPFGPPQDATAPDQPEPEKLEDHEPENPNCMAGSIIECENQVLRESVPIPGTALSLNYSSARVPGKKTSREIKIFLTGAQVPPSLQEVKLIIQVAGQEHEFTFPPLTNQTHIFEWNGRNGWGQVVQGAVAAHIKIGYVYDGVYYEPSQYAQAFALFGPALITGSETRGQVTIWQESQIGVSTYDFRELGMGAWSLSDHHLYDSTSKTIWMGDGAKRSKLGSTKLTVRTIAGTGQSGFSGDGGPAHLARLNAPKYALPRPDGSYIISDTGNHRIRRVDPNGIITTIAGTGVPGLLGDGGPAIQAQLNTPTGLDVDSEGNLYIADSSNSRVRKIDPDGTITTFAGSISGFSGDGGPAISARLHGPRDVKIAPDGSVFIADSLNMRIRRVGADGIITTVAGNGNLWTNPPSGQPALSIGISAPQRMAFGPDGALYFVAFIDFSLVNSDVMRLEPSGTITVVVDGYPIPSKGNWWTGVAVHPEYGPLAVASGTEIGRLDLSLPDPFPYVRIAGGGLSLADGIIPQRAKIQYTHSLTVTPAGGLIFAESNAGMNRVRGIQNMFPSFSINSIVVPSKDGRIVDEFDSSGRHLRTVDALTNQDIVTFGYHPNGRLESMIDVHGNEVTLGLDQDGRINEILAPFGQITRLSYNEDGYLSAVQYPDNSTFEFQYHDGGLLARFEDPRNYASQFFYDESGRLLSDEDAASGVQALARNQVGNSWTITTTSPLNRTRIHSVEPQANGYLERTTVRTDGKVVTTEVHTNGLTQTLYPDGAVVAVTETADPRFQMQSPYPETFSFQNPGMGTLQGSSSRVVVLANPADPLSLQRLTQTVTINTHTWTSIFDKVAHTFTTTTPLGRQVVANLDDLGRIIQLAIPTFEPIERSYNSFGAISTIVRGSGNELREVSLTYNPQGFLHTLTDPIGRVHTLEYDVLGRVIRQTLPGTREILYEYDQNGNITSIGPPDRPFHYFQYDSVNQNTSYQAPLLPPENNTTIFHYDLDRALTRVDRPDGQAVILGYHPTSGNLISTTYPQGVINYSYSSSTGNLSTVAGPNGVQLLYQYFGSVPSLLMWTGPVAGNVSYSYDSAFRLSSLRVNSANPINYSYDNDNLLTAAGALTLTRHPQHGLVTATSIGSGGNQVTEGFAYSPFAELERFEGRRGGALIYEVDYNRDKLGRIIQRTETMLGSSEIYEYVYDPAGRLQEVRLNGGVIGSYGYDLNGNRISSNGVSATYDDQDRLLQFGDTQFSYNQNGEMRTRVDGSGTTTYDYDAFGTLTAATLPTGQNIEYILDGTGRRIGRKVNGVLQQGFLYQDALNPIAELNGAGTVVSRFVYGSRAHVPDYMIKGGVTYRILSDHLGSVRLVINLSNGTTAQRIDYDVWGNITQDTNPGFQPFGFAGGIYDQDTKLTQFGVREYDPRIGRWTSKDPIGFAGGDTNLYGYVVQDPVNYIDPSGLIAPWDIVDLVSFANDISNFYNEPSFSSGMDALLGALGALPGVPSIAAIKGIGNVADAAADAAKMCNASKKPKWPNTAEEMEKLLGVPGRRIPDTPRTPGRQKTEWRPNERTRIVSEQHPYHPDAPDFHKKPHWHLDTPDGVHQRFIPGDDIPGF